MIHSESPFKTSESDFDKTFAGFITVDNQKIKMDFSSDSESDFGEMPSDLSDEEQSENENEPPCVVTRSRGKSAAQDATSRIWSKTARTTQPPLFTKHCGVDAARFSQAKTPVHFFLQFVDQDILENIRIQTQLYSDQHTNSSSSLNTEITTEDLYAFIGTNFIMGYHQLPSVRDYWSSNPHFHVPIVANSMARDRFLNILANLHVNDNSKLPKDNTDKLYKLRPMITALNNNFKSLRTPGQSLSIDESTVKFKGRSTLKQFNPNKPNKRHFKIWAAADSEGYIFWFQIYQGKFAEPVMLPFPYPLKRLFTNFFVIGFIFSEETR